MKTVAYTRPFCTTLCPRLKNPEATCPYCHALTVHDRFFACWRRWGWNIWQYSGVREICALINPNWRAATKPKASTFVLWVVGIYVALFGLASQLYESRRDQIEDRSNSIYAQLGTPNAKKALARIPRAQAMTLPRKPELWPPWSVLCSLIGKQLRDRETVESLIEVVETYREDLKRVNLNSVSLIGANLSGAQLISTGLVGADLRGADLSGVDLSETPLAGDVVSAYDVKYVTAYWDHNTQWPEGFTPPCPVSTPDDPCQTKK